MKVKLYITKDGSHTLSFPELNEHYHSVNGAISESKHIFIEAGLKQISKKQINILEVGFGTGLNLLVTLKENKTLNRNIYYETLELYPLNIEIVEKLNYPDILDCSRELFLKIHQLEWEEIHTINNFSLKKIKVDIRKYKTSNTFDLVYFDAFAPDKQNDLWSLSVFKNIFSIMNKGGVLVTYSAKGIVKQALRDAGFEVKRLKGPEGKRHIVRAIKK